ncbi:BRCT domain-containing protein [Cercophora newfieldiana]|uniref:BRCT domain-containing protein n=1 Tax=Cercophora newfieldiana TaxID=92897 RepID=A0AA39XWP5_9PEZI|nr:BRCT domain-containing protein [Cercophora newfieldiana]
MAEQDEKPGVLSSCLLAFVPSSSLTPLTISELSKIVKENGAQVLEPTRQGKIRIPDATHIISNTIDFDQYKEAVDMMIPIVNSNWIKNSIMRGKTAQVRPYSPDPRMIFSNVVLTCADIPEVDKETILGATMAMGGMESKDLSRQTTHICALTMDHPKCQEAVAKHPKCKIVLPHWFDDCFKLGKRIDEGPYLLPDPEYCSKGSEDEVKIPPSQSLDGAVSAVPNTLIEGRKKVIVFAQKKVMLSTDLNLNARLRNIITGIITDGGGEVVDVVDSCDMFICHFRDGPQYVRAAQARKDVGNLAWLYHLIVHNEWTSPFRRLLHYPIPREPLEGFKDMRISLSNYGGDSRIYLENLITAAGATYTKTMTANNTHLITARNHSEKCEAAKDWNIQVVNHLWIEESYARCKVQSISARYQHFPARTNLGEVIGQTFHDEEVLKALFYPGGEENSGRSVKRKRKSMADGLENGRSAQKGGSGFNVMNDSSPAVARNARAPRGTQATAGEFTTPAKGRHVRSGKENDTPSAVSTGSRSAKAQALSKLHGLAPDIALYEKEKKRTKDGPWGGKRAADQIDKERSMTTSSSPAPREDEENDVQKSVSKRAQKKQRLSLPDVEMRVVLTGYQRWLDDISKEEADKKKLRAMGILIVQDNLPCDYLAAPHMVRTKKFLRCLSRGPEVISSMFIDACLEAGKRLDPADYTLKDKENEKKWGIKLSTSVARARANRGRLLQSVPIYCTADIKNGCDNYQTIAEANGAIFKIYRARSGTTIKPTTAEEDGGAPPEPVYLLTSDSAAEKVLWGKFEKMAKDGHMEPRIVAPDWLLDVCMRQELTFHPKLLARNVFPS